MPINQPRPKSWFTRIATETARMAGQPATFATALVLILLWGLSGPVFGYSDTWQLVINTTTTIVTFLMVFLIQHTQNRDAEAVHVKLDELIRAMKGAHNALLDLEELETGDIDRIRSEYENLAERARKHLRNGHRDTGNSDAVPGSRSKKRTPQGMHAPK